MDKYDFTYELPKNFDNRVKQYLVQSGGAGVSDAFQRCQYEYDVLDYAYYEGMKGDNWNKKAVDFTIEVNIYKKFHKNKKKKIIINEAQQELI